MVHETAIRQISDVQHKLPSLVETAAFNIARIEKILNDSIVIEVSDDVLIRAAKRAIDKRAPFHLQKNSMADAAIMEIYTDCIKEEGNLENQYGFVTHNKEDFGAVDKRLPHPDFADCFLEDRSYYFVRLIDALRHFVPELVSDIEAEQEWDEIPRTLSELLAAESEFRDKIWYNYHKVLAYKIKNKEVKLIDSKDWTAKYHSVTCTREVWKKAKEAAKKMEEKYGKANLGPYDTFEWGELWGKLTALRWATGSDWDFKDL